MKKHFTLLSLIFILRLSCSTGVLATIITVPIDYPSIQEAINNSIDFDTVVVQSGNYLENLNFNGKKIMLTSLFYLSNDTSYISNTIIDGGNPVNADTGSCVIFSSGENVNSIIQGFTITGGTGTKW